MEITKNQKIIIGVSIIIIFFVVYFVFDKRSKDDDVIDDLQTVATTTLSVDGGIKTDGGSYTIESVEFNQPVNLPPTPDLNREVVVSSGAIISPEAKTVAVEKIKLIQAQLKENSKNWGNWIDLGIYQKMAGDYEGAVISWKYARALAPTDYISVANLGNLYAYFLKDNGQAEVYYREAISKGPLQSYLYTQLTEIYRDVFKDLEKAQAIVAEGLSKIPNDPNLLQLQTSLK